MKVTDGLFSGASFNGVFLLLCAVSLRVALFNICLFAISPISPNPCFSNHLQQLVRLLSSIPLVFSTPCIASG